MSPLDPSLPAHTARLLVGTDLTPDDAQALAASATDAPDALGAAIQDGWRAAADQGSDPR